MWDVRGAHCRCRLKRVISALLILSSTAVGSTSNGGGVLISYEKYVELLDPLTGDVKGTFDTDLNYVSDLLVINGTSKSVVLTELVDGSKSKLHLVQLDRGHSTFLRLVPEKTFPLIKSMAYDWRRGVLNVMQSRRVEKIDFQTWTTRSIEIPDVARSLAVDSCHSILYWASKTAIYRHDEDDASAPPAVVLQNVSQPNNLVVSGRYLYWMEKLGYRYSVKRLHLETYGLETLCEHSSEKHKVSVYSMAVDSENRTLYWADWYNSAVWKIKFTSGNTSQTCNPTIVRDLGTTRPLGIGIVRNAFGVDERERKCDRSEKPLLPEIKVTTEKVVISELKNEEDDHCHNYCFNHDLDPTSMTNTEKEVTVNWSRCSYDSSMGIPICRCQTGFSGSRCQIDLCKNLCLNGGQCLRRKNHQECLCLPGFSGGRCDVVASGEDPLNFFYLFVVTIIFFGASIVLSILLVCENSRIRRKLAAALENPKSANHPAILEKAEKSSKVISLIRSRSKTSKGGRDEHCYVNKEICVPFVDSICDKNVDQTGVVLDLEDCCHMTLCDTPCVEASFTRRPRKRTQSRTVSVSQLEDGDKGDDTQKLIYDGVQY